MLPTVIFALLGIGFASFVIGSNSEDGDALRSPGDQTGTSDDDYLQLSDDAGADFGILDGLDGDDTLLGHNDYQATLSGGSGDDEIRARGEDVAYGGNGNDIIDATGSSTVFGGDGSDTISLFDSTTGYGDAGDDLFYIHDTDGSIRSFGGSGNDTFTIDLNDSEANGTVEVEGGDGEDEFLILAPENFDNSAPILTITDFDVHNDVLVVEALDYITGSAGRYSALNDVSIVQSSTDIDYTDVIIEWENSEVRTEYSNVTIRLEGVRGFDVSNVVLFFQHVDASSDLDLTAGHYLEFVEAATLTTGLEIDINNSYILAGPTPDQLQITSNETLLATRSGDDVIRVVAGGVGTWSAIMAGEGDDRVEIAAGEALVFGGAGDDVLNSVNNSDQAVNLHGGIGDDRLEIRMGHEAHGGLGSDIFALHVLEEDLGKDPAVISGTEGGSIQLFLPASLHETLSVLTTYSENGVDVIHSTIFSGEHALLQILGVSSNQLQLGGDLLEILRV